MKSFVSFVRNLLFILVAVFSAGTLFVIANGIAAGSELTPFNIAVEDVVMHMRTPFLTNIFLFITNAGSPLVLGIVAVAIAVTLYVKRDTYDALLYISSIALSILSFDLLKQSFHIARPLQALITLTSWSFPSGHATIATAFFFSTGYTYFSKVKTFAGKVGLVAGCIFGALIISFSRIYLGVHFALDVLAGITLGILAVSTVVLLFNIFLEEEKWRHRKLFRKM
jgi:membrane-associated phospholipid phosphatase